MTENLITKREAAELLGVSLSTVDRLIRDGDLETQKYGDKPQSPVRVWRTDVMKVKKGRPPAARKPGAHLRRRVGRETRG